MSYRLNLAAAQWKARKLNEILPELQAQFEGALNQGVILELESGMGDSLEQLFEEAVLAG